MVLFNWFLENACFANQQRSEFTIHASSQNTNLLNLELFKDSNFYIFLSYFEDYD